MPLHEKLRKPDFARQQTPHNLTLWLKDGLLDICRPFKPWALPAEPCWNEDPYGDDTWGLYYHSLVWLSVLDMGAERADTEEQRESCGRRLRELFVSYVRFLATTADGETHKMVWFDHSTAWRASTLSYLYEKHFRGSLSPEQEAQLAWVVRTHADKLQDFIASGRWGANNHGIFHAEALWDMSHVFGNVLPDETRDVALTAMRNVYGEMIDAEEGVCREHSLYYHLFDAWLLAQGARYMAGFGIDVIPGYRKVLQDMIEFYHRVAPGMRCLPAVGDTTFGRAAENPMLHEISAVVEPTALSKILSGKSAGDHCPDRLTSFPRTGFHIFHDAADGDPSKANVAVLLDKPYLGAHAHVDGGSFTLSLGGEDFIVDSGGPYAYGNKLRFDYFKAAEAHNVLMVGRKSRRYLTRTTSTVSGPSGHGVRLLCEDLGGVRWQRLFMDLGAGTYLVLDGVESEKRHRVDAIFRLSPTIALEEHPSGLIEARSSTRSLFIHQVCGCQMERTLNQGGGDSFPRSWVTRDLAHMEPTPVLCTGFRAAKGWLVTLLTTNPEAGVEVHKLHSGKLLRIILTEHVNGVGRIVDVDMANPGKAPKVLRFRRFGVATSPLLDSPE